MDNLDVSLISEIISFIGPNQYRFVAATSRKFRNAHLLVFPHQTNTYLNASTLERAKICLDEIISQDFKSHLCRLAIRHGKLLVLKYLRSVHPHWRVDVCAEAVKYGHLNIIIWARENGLP